MFPPEQPSKHVTVSPWQPACPMSEMNRIKAEKKNRKNGFIMTPKLKFVIVIALNMPKIFGEHRKNMLRLSIKKTNATLSIFDQLSRAFCQNEYIRFHIV